MAGVHFLLERIESDLAFPCASPSCNFDDRISIKGIDASEADVHPGYAPDYWGVFYADPDGIRLEVTHYRQERHERHDNWE